MPDYERIIVNKKRLDMFGGKKCACRCWKATDCGGDVTHLAVVNDKMIYVCAHHADKLYEVGVKIYEMWF